MYMSSFWQCPFLHLQHLLWVLTRRRRRRRACRHHKLWCYHLHLLMGVGTDLPLSIYISNYLKINHIIITLCFAFHACRLYNIVYRAIDIYTSWDAMWLCVADSSQNHSWCCSIRILPFGFKTCRWNCWQYQSEPKPSSNYGSWCC